MEQGKKRKIINDNFPIKSQKIDTFEIDMFSSSPIPTDKDGTNNIIPNTITNNDNDNNDNFDDNDGYLNYIPNAIINGYKVFAFCGKGVFSSVFRVYDINTTPTNNNPLTTLNNNNENIKDQLVLKVIRKNDMMKKVGLRECNFLKLLTESKTSHIIKLYSTFDYKGHLVMALEGLNCNLRGLLKKFGDIGLHISAVQSYSRQLLLSLKALKNLKILHCDIKPDNILCNFNLNIVKLTDFGASIQLPIDNYEYTPLLYSRYYRPPEIILGINYSNLFECDIWALGATLFELYTGKILIPGANNNEMIKLMIELVGEVFPAKLIRKATYKDSYFDDNYNFLEVINDPITNTEIVKKYNTNNNRKDINTRISNSISSSEEQKKLSTFIDLLNKMIVLDPNKRITVEKALLHPFIKNI